MSKTEYNVSPQGVITKVETPDPVETTIDPAGIKAEIINLEMNLSEQKMIESRAMEAEIGIQAKIDALQAVLEVPEVKATLAALPVKEVTP
jgi:hypothetical protein